MSGGGGTNTQVQNADPWSGQQPYLKEGFAGAQQGILSQPGVVPFSPETQYGLTMQGNRALQGSALLPAANQQIQDTLSGNYMSGGQGFNDFADAAWSAVRPNVDSTFATGGRYGSALHGEALGRGFGRAMAPLYDSERQRQMSAAGMSPGLAMADYQDPAMLQAVGAAREGKAQQYADESYNRLARYMGLISGNYGGTSTTTGGAGQSPLMGAAGGALTGASVGSAFGPWGAGIGAIGGGLLGAMG